MKTYKVIFTAFAVMVLGAFVITSCSNEGVSERETNNDFSKREGTGLEEVLLNPNNSWIAFDGKYTVITDDEIIHYDENDNFHHFVEAGNNFGYDFIYDEINDYTTVINTENQSEYFEIHNINIEDNIYSFDVRSSSGIVINDLRLFTPDFPVNEPQNIRIWLAVIELVVAILDAVVASSPGDCQSAINACVQAGGKPSTKITDNWWGYSCTVTCN